MKRTIQFSIRRGGTITAGYPAARLAAAQGRRSGSPETAARQRADKNAQGLCPDLFRGSTGQENLLRSRGHRLFLQASGREKTAAVSVGLSPLTPLYPSRRPATTHESGRANVQGR